MTKRQAFVRQARSDLAVFDHLVSESKEPFPECHSLHYLQMATEKLAKAALIALNVTFDPYSHVAFSMLPRLLARRDVAGALGLRDFMAYRRLLSRTAPLFREVDELNPAVGLQSPTGGSKDGPNVEYPWEARALDGSRVWIVPAEHYFGLLKKLHASGDGAKMLALVRLLMDRFDAVFG